MKKAKKKEGHFFLTFFLHSFLGSSSRCALFFLSPICVSFVVQSSSSFPNNTREPSQREWTQHCSTPSRVTFCGTSNRVCVLSLSLSLSLERERERERGFDSSGTQCLRFPIYRVVATSRVFAKSRTRSSN